MVLFHRDEGGDVSAADGARLLGLDQLLSAAFADAEVTAGHYQGVLGVGETDEALCVGVVFFDHLAPFFGTVLVGHAVD